MNNLQTLAAKLLSDYNIDQNDGTQDIATTEAYTVATDDLHCPCCRAKLRLVDSSKQEFADDDIVQVAESTMNENKLSDFLLEIIENAARNIYEDELETEEPEVDSMGNINQEYTERFRYVSDSLKKIVSMKANAISNMVKQNGIEVSPFYIENEIFQILKSYSYK